MNGSYSQSHFDIINVHTLSHTLMYTLDGNLDVFTKKISINK